MKKIYLTLLVAFIASIADTDAQRFDWVSFTPLTTNNGNGGSGTLSVTNDDEGNIYSICVFNDPIVAGSDTLYHTGNFGRPDILLVKWNQEGQVLAYRHIANYSNNGNPDPQRVLFDEVNGEILLNIMSYYSGMQITLLANDSEPDLPLSLATGAVLRFTTDLEFVSHKTIPGGTGYTTPAVVKDEYLYAAQGYYSTISKTDTTGNAFWTVDPSTSFYIQDIAISNQDTIYVIGYSQYGGTVSLGGISVTAPSTGNFTHTMIFKMDTAGTVHQGIHFIEAANYIFQTRLTTDSDGNVYATASYEIGGQTIGDHTLSNPTGARDGIVTKFSSNLQPQWTTEFQHTGGDMRITDVIVHEDGKVMAIGTYGGVATFGAFPLSASTYGSCFLAQLNNTDGSVLYATNYGALTGSAIPYSVSNVNDKYYIGGLSYASGQNAASYGCYTDTYTCAFLTAFTDTLFQSPTVSLQYNGPELVATSNVSGATYQWFLDGVEIEGETGNTITPETIGTYEVQIYYYGCSVDATLEITEIINSIDWVNGEQGRIQIYPNPAMHSATIGNAPVGAIVNITDVYGKTVFRSTIKSNTEAVNTSEFEAGLYFVRIEGQGLIVSRKLVVNH